MEPRRTLQPLLKLARCQTLTTHYSNSSRCNSSNNGSIHRARARCIRLMAPHSQDNSHLISQWVILGQTSRYARGIHTWISTDVNSVYIERYRHRQCIHMSIEQYRCRQCIHRYIEWYRHRQSIHRYICSQSSTDVDSVYIDTQSGTDIDSLYINTYVHRAVDRWRIHIAVPRYMDRAIQT